MLVNVYYFDHIATIRSPKFKKNQFLGSSRSKKISALSSTPKLTVVCLRVGEFNTLSETRVRITSLDLFHPSLTSKQWQQNTHLPRRKCKAWSQSRCRTNASVMFFLQSNVLQGPKQWTSKQMGKANTSKDDRSKDEIKIKRFSPLCYFGSKFALTSACPQLPTAGLPKHAITFT